jgi:hypothetical protein
LKWLLVVAIYTAPPNAVDWHGPWGLGMTKLLDQQFDSEAQCRNFAVQFIGKMHEGMLAPMRYRCVSIDRGLPKGAPR